MQNNKHRISDIGTQQVTNSNLMGKMQSEWQTTHWNFHQQFEIICFSIVLFLSTYLVIKLVGICIEVTLGVKHLLIIYILLARH